MHQDGTTVFHPHQAKRRDRAPALRMERRYAPDLARQAQALLRLLACRSGESAPRQRNEDAEQLDQALPACEDDEND